MADDKRSAVCPFGVDAFRRLAHSLPETADVRVVDHGIGILPQAHDRFSEAVTRGADHYASINSGASRDHNETVVTTRNGW